MKSGHPIFLFNYSCCFCLYVQVDGNYVLSFKVDNFSVLHQNRHYLVMSFQVLNLD